MKHYIPLFIVLVLAGCQNQHRANPEFRLIKGTVTFNGAPVKGAVVAFVPTDGTGIGAGGSTDEAGLYTLTADNALVPGSGTKPGKYKVTVKKTEAAVDPDRQDLESGKITEDEFMKRLAERKPIRPKNLLPGAYADAKTTPLEVTVEDKKENVIDLLIEGK